MGPASDIYRMTFVNISYSRTVLEINFHYNFPLKTFRAVDSILINNVFSNSLCAFIKKTEAELSFFVFY